MTKGKSKVLKVVAALIIIGMIAGGGYAYSIVYKERNRCREDLAKSEKQAARLRQKFAQEQSKATALMRTKQSLEGRVRAMQTQIDQIAAERQALEGEINGNYEVKIKEFEEKIEKLLKRIESVKASRDEVVVRYKEKSAVVKENEQKIAQLSETLQQTDFELKRVGRQLDNCKENNGRLCMITEELIDKYKTKGVVGSLIIKEPFTQLEQVEVEKLVQEYTGKIEKERIE